MLAKQSDRKIVLIDGNSLAYRAFYALPETMKTGKGQITNAVYGFTTMLLKILEGKPDFVAIAFDRAAPTFRHKAFTEYKATRQKTPPTLYQQMPLVREIANVFDIPVYEIDGYEADDVIGTLDKEAEKMGYEVTIVSGDLDPLQLVTEKTKLLATKKGISDTVLYDRTAVEKRYGLLPEQIADLKALKGDQSDNIPGVPGIGEKTAVELLKEFGSLKNIMNNMDKIESPRIEKLLKENIEKAILSKKLATIITEVPIEINFGACERKEIDWEKVLPLFEELEFKSLIKKFGERTEEYGVDKVIERKREKLKKLKYITVDEDDVLESLIEKLKKSSGFAIDTETTGVDPFRAELVGISLCEKSGESYYIPVGHTSGKQIDREKIIGKLKPVIESEIPKYGHSIKYDMEILSNCGINLGGLEFDTIVAAYLLNPTSGGYGLKKLAASLLDRKMIELDELIGKKAQAKDFREVAIPLATDYAASDADVTFELMQLFKKKIKEEKLDKLFYEIEMPLVGVLTKMETVGVFVDKAKLKVMSKEMGEKIKKLEKDIYALAGEEFNINSPKQLANILFDKLKIPVTKRTKTGASTDISVLEELSPNFEIAGKLMEYRTLAKIRSTYVDVLPELINGKTGRIHTSFNQTVTATGRLSSSDPNLQNIPVKGELGQKIREAFVPEAKGWKILAADYSQVELRILAHLSQDKYLVKAFMEDMDVHRATASEVFGVPLEEVTPEMRETAKMVNFGIIYGISEFGLAKGLKIKKTEAATYIEKYFEKHSGVKEFIDKLTKQAKEDEYVSTLLGRKRPLPDINNPNYTFRSFAERTAINTPVQGTAADIIKIAMINIHRQLKNRDLKSKMILQVHDELVFEVPENEAEEMKKMVKHEMENAIELDVPVKVNIGIGNSWAEAK
ncbi:MAG: DNA polymerase I [Candidatus Saganbacteria bacterium]|nr:DNA polymerase I [Candidatus Saganbacteria bacterium]